MTDIVIHLYSFDGKAWTPGAVQHSLPSVGPGQDLSQVPDVHPRVNGRRLQAAEKLLDMTDIGAAGQEVRVEQACLRACTDGRPGMLAGRPYFHANRFREVG